MDKKLNSRETNALASKLRGEIVKELVNVNKEKNEKILLDFYETDKGKMVKELQDWDTDGRLINTSRLNQLIGIVNNTYVSTDTIERDLIIEQISCDGLDDLIKKVKLKYIKTDE